MQQEEDEAVVKAAEDEAGIKAPADDDDDEHLHQQICTHCGRELLTVKTPHGTTESGQCSTSHKHTDKYTLNAVAQGLHHLPVFNAGTNQKTNPRAPEQQQKAHVQNQAQHHGNQSRAAQSLGLTLRQFSYRLRKAGLR